MIYREGFDRLMHSRKFWLAVVALGQTLLFHFLPQFPQDIWISINAIIGLLIITITVDDLSNPPTLTPPDGQG